MSIFTNGPYVSSIHLKPNCIQSCGVYYTIKFS